MSPPSIYHLSEPVVLASASPRRRKLLRKLISDFKVLIPRVQERMQPNHDAEELAKRLAVAKAKWAAGRLSRGTVIAADTLVAARGEKIVGKPSNREEAIDILTELSGTRHKVITGVCVIDVESGRELTMSEGTWVKMRKMSSQEITEYVNSGEAIGKAGAYAIQETGDRYVAGIEGSFSNVVGLPLELLDRMLKELGAK